MKKKIIVMALMVLAGVVIFILVGTYFFKGKELPITPQQVQKQIDKEQPQQAPEKTSINEEEKPINQTIDRVEKEKSFSELNKDLIDICRGLDSKDYIAKYRLDGGTYKHIMIIMEKLAYSPPVVSGETRDLYVLLSNTAHLYRVLGKDDINLLKDIQKHEQNRIELLMSVAYEYMIKGNDEKKLKVNIGQLYEYAGFFLDTLGGKSYLYRRDSKMRNLVRYYSILILDKANKERKNPYGIDIMQHVKLLKEDIRASNDLAEKEKYLTVLKTIEVSNIH